MYIGKAHFFLLSGNIICTVLVFVTIFLWVLYTTCIRFTLTSTNIKQLDYELEISIMW